MGGRPRVAVVLIDGPGSADCAPARTSGRWRGSILDGTADAMTFVADEYEMNATLASYPKPIVAVQRGITSAAAWGCRRTAAIRIVSEDSTGDAGDG